MTSRRTLESGELVRQVDDLRRRHPSLEDRLERYRDRKEAYDAKRKGRAPAATENIQPTHHRGVSREYTGS